MQLPNFGVELLFALVSLSLRRFELIFQQLLLSLGLLEGMQLLIETLAVRLQGATSLIQLLTQLLLISEVI